jgi:ComEC/Rec2-related protein
LLPPAVAVFCGTLGGLYFGGEGIGCSSSTGAYFSFSVGTHLSFYKSWPLLWVLAVFTLIVLLCFFVGLWLLRRRPGHSYLRLRRLRPRPRQIPFFYSRAHLRYKFGRPLYLLGLLALFGVAFWNGLMDNVFSVPGIPDGEPVYLVLRVLDYPVSVVTRAGRHYDRVECALVSYSLDGQHGYPGHQNVQVYVATGSQSLFEGTSDFGFQPVSDVLLPGDVFSTRSKMFLLKEQGAVAAGKTSASVRDDVFDYAEYMARRGFYRRVYVYDYKRVEGKLTVRERLLRLRVPLTAPWGVANGVVGRKRGGQGRVAGARVRGRQDGVVAARERAGQDSVAATRERAGQLLAGICLGAKSTLNREVRECFNRVGASHILAVSGLHVGALYGSLVWLLGFWGKLWNERRYRRRGKVLPPVLNRRYIYKTYSLRRGAWVHVPALLLIWAYAMVVGLSTSVVRAALMLTVYGISRLRGYRAFGLNVLSIAALVLVVWKPTYVLDLGFQLSFSAVLSLMLFFTIFRNLLSVRKTVLKYLWELFCASLAVQLGTLCLTWNAFGMVPLYSLFCNMLIIPLAALILYVFLGYLVLYGVLSVVLGKGFVVPLFGVVDGALGKGFVGALQWAFGAVIEAMHILADVLYKVVVFFDNLPYSPIEYAPNAIDLLLVLWCLAYVLIAHGCRS